MARANVVIAELLPPAASSAGRARELVREALTRADALDWADAATLAVSEVVTNALVHAGTVIHLQVKVESSCLRVEITDGSPHHPLRRDYTSMAATGRGLKMLDECVDRWGVRPHGDGKVVWFELLAAGVAGDEDSFEPAAARPHEGRRRRRGGAAQRPAPDARGLAGARLGAAPRAAPGPARRGARRLRAARGGQRRAERALRADPRPRARRGPRRAHGDRDRAGRLRGGPPRPGAAQLGVALRDAARPARGGDGRGDRGLPPGAHHAAGDPGAPRLALPPGARPGARGDAAGAVGARARTSGSPPRTSTTPAGTTAASRPRSAHCWPPTRRASSSP